MIRYLPFILVAMAACGGGESAGPASALPVKPAYDAPGDKGAAAADKHEKAKDEKDPRAICEGAPALKVGSAPSWLREKEAPIDERAGAKAKDYAMADLQALANKSAWQELLGHAEDVSPAQRDGNWDKLIEKAAVGYMQQLSGDSTQFDAVFTSQSLVGRYPHLTNSKAFMSKRDDAGKGAAESCLRDAYRGDHCLKMMRDFLKTTNTSADVGFAFGKITQKNQNAYVAVPFFTWSLDHKNDPSLCKDDDLKLATIAGLGLPSDDESAGGARHIAASVCWDSMHDDIKKALLESPTGYVRDNACAVMSAKGALK